MYVSCLGTTRAGAGGFEQQKKIDLDLNRDLAKKAREDGASVVSHTSVRTKKGKSARRRVHADLIGYSGFVWRC